jgi:hypothetical protein
MPLVMQICNTEAVPYSKKIWPREVLTVTLSFSSPCLLPPAPDVRCQRRPIRRREPPYFGPRCRMVPLRPSHTSSKSFHHLRWPELPIRRHELSRGDSGPSPPSGSRLRGRVTQDNIDLLAGSLHVAKL